MIFVLIHSSKMAPKLNLNFNYFIISTQNGSICCHSVLSIYQKTYAVLYLVSVKYFKADNDNQDISKGVDLEFQIISVTIIEERSRGC